MTRLRFNCVWLSSLLLAGTVCAAPATGPVHILTKAPGLMVVTAKQTRDNRSGSKLVSSSYSVIDLGTLYGPSSVSEATGINDNGEVVGISYSDSKHHAFVWNNGVMTDIGTKKKSMLTEAYAINNHGEVGGVNYPLGGFKSNRAFLWRNGEMYSLGTADRWSYSRELGINNIGQVVGTVSSAAKPTYPNLYAFLWSDKNGLRILGTLGGPQSGANAINNKGDVVGYSSRVGYSKTGATTAVLWHDGMTINLGTFTGWSSTAWGINDHDQVVGSYLPPGTTLGEGRAFLWSQGKMTDLGTLGAPNAFPTAINNQGEVVGSSETAQGPIHAFLWENGEIVDLNDLIPADSGWILSSANAINNRGQIVGNGTFHGLKRAFLLTPVHHIKVPRPPLTKLLVGINLHPINVNTLCRTDELVGFSCELSNKKIVSICASPNATNGSGYVQYRFGRSSSSIELEYPQDGVSPGGHFKQHFFGARLGYEWGLSFWSGAYRYSVIETQYGSQDVAGVVVDRNHKLVAFDQCINSTIAQTVLSSSKTVAMPSKSVLPKFPNAGDDISYVPLESLELEGWRGKQSIVIGSAAETTENKWLTHLPFYIGESTANVYKQAISLGITQQNALKTELYIKSLGIFLFFNNNDNIREIRLHYPFAGQVDGIKIGDSLSTLEASLGNPSRSPWLFAQNMAYLYRTARLTYRFDVGPDNAIHDIFIFKK